jgi:hypothetical protein
MTDRLLAVHGQDCVPFRKRTNTCLFQTLCRTLYVVVRVEVFGLRIYNLMDSILSPFLFSHFHSWLFSQDILYQGSQGIM